MTQTQTQLLPCPFCGGEAELEIDIIDVWLAQRLYTVECSNGECLAVSDRFAAPERATAWWNRRAESADLVALRQQVQELLDALAERQQCPICGGNGTRWSLVGDEAEPEPCDCFIKAHDVLMRYGSADHE